LDTDEGYSIVVQVLWMSQEKQMFRGTVTHGYYPKDESDCIKEGAVVEFSKKKIGGIFKKE
ncbi:MAG: hypothetical protein R6X29_09410, partial [Acidimicrobiia bacterium]